MIYFTRYQTSRQCVHLCLPKNGGKKLFISAAKFQWEAPPLSLDVDPPLSTHSLDWGRFIPPLKAPPLFCRVESKQSGLCNTSAFKLKTVYVSSPGGVIYMIQTRLIPSRPVVSKPNLAYGRRFPSTLDTKSHLEHSAHVYGSPLL